MKIKLNELHIADWRFVNTPQVNLYEGKQITYRQSTKYGYRFTIIEFHSQYYVTQALYNPATNSESISVHTAPNLNDAKVALEVMIQFIVGMRKRIGDQEPADGNA